MDICILNSPCVVGGRLYESETWTTNRIYVVRDNVVVPSGVTLTIQNGCIVKFTEKTHIYCEGSGVLNLQGATLASIADDAIGGDTNLDGDASRPTTDEWLKGGIGDGLIEVDFNVGDHSFMRLYQKGSGLGTMPVPLRVGYVFTGRWTEVSDGVRIQENVNITENVTFYAHWIPTTFTVTFNANGGVGGTTRSVSPGAAVGVLPTLTRTGYTFAGWWTTASGGLQILASTIVTDDVTYYAKWTVNSGGGSGGGSGTGGDSGVAGDGSGTAGGGLDTTDAGSGFTCGGSGTTSSGSGTTSSGSGAAGGGAGTEVSRRLYGSSAYVYGTVPAVGATYDGYLYRGGTVVGMIQVKVGRLDKDGTAAVKATVIQEDGKKIFLKAAGNGKVQISAGGSTVVSFESGYGAVTLGTEGMSGTYGAYDVDGASNVFTSKVGTDKAVAAAVLGRWQGAVNVAWESAQGWNGLTVNIAGKGRANVSGTLADGVKVSAKSQLIVGDEWCCVPVVYAKKGARLLFTLWLSRTGAALPSVVGLGDNVKVGKPGSLKPGAAFKVDATLGDAHFAAYLPNGVAVAGGAKWTLPKAGKVIYVKGTSAVDESALGENPSALKLSYKAKDGTFKGSFKVYSDVGGKLKATTVTVTGVLVNGVGYGSATIKKVSSVPVRVE